MFTAEMIAPCGLDCSICSRALAEKDPCPGCLGPDENKPEFCSKRCGIILCRKRQENGYTYCDECPDYPCADVSISRKQRTDRSGNRFFRDLFLFLRKGGNKRKPIKPIDLIGKCFYNERHTECGRRG